MRSLDHLVSELGQRFSISPNSASRVLSGILSLMERHDGGLSGFLDRFRRVGMGTAVTSWLGGNTKAMTRDAVTTVLGRDTIGAIASASGLIPTVAGSAIGFLIPKVVHRLAPTGTLPLNPPNEITSYPIGPNVVLASGAREALYGAEKTARQTSIHRYLRPFLGILAAFFLGVQFWRAHNLFDPQEQARLATERTESALTALMPGYSARDVVDALNLGAINFTSSSAEVLQDDYEVLDRSAAAIKNAPSGTLIEIGGHTDGLGDANSNMELSQQRADNVRAYLVRQGVEPSVVVARGYGDTKPVATNDTEEGRFHNRRIEFTVMRE